ncbi:hypothetical protein [Motilimonas cestriensis]|uniref:hypothetical protein n=1 Tax=Motilimonas cestriensis TaxID=2742685 RepID=UPI003DA336A8
MSKSFFSAAERNEIEQCLKTGGDVRIEKHPDLSRSDLVVRFYPASPYDATERCRLLGKNPAESHANQAQAEAELSDIKTKVAA